MERNNKIENNAPSILSNKNTLFMSDLDLPGNCGIAGGSTKNFVPDRNTAALKLKEPDKFFCQPGASILSFAVLFNENTINAINKSNNKTSRIGEMVSCIR